jgi:CelD/BcsL family acetyltransferase involved in cellulose biosynthesis
VQVTNSPPSRIASPDGFRVTVHDSFDALPAAYASFLDDGGRATVFLSQPWFRNFVANALDTDARVRIYGVETTSDAPTPVAVLPMRHLPGRHGTAGPRVLSSLSSYYSPIFGPLVAPNSRDMASPFAALVSFLVRERPRWDVLDLAPLDLLSPVGVELTRCLQSAGLVVQRYFCFGNWYLLVEGRSYTAYANSLPSALRNTLKRKRARLDRSADVRFDVLTGLEGLDDAITAYEKVYASSWKVPEPYPDFVPGLIRMCGNLGWLRLGLARVDGEPAAVQLWIVRDGVASIFKLAYDDRFSKLSVGSLLTARLMEHVIDVDRVHLVDYLCGDDAYKKDWMSHRQERWGLMAFNPRTARGALAAIRHVGGHALKAAFQALTARVASRREHISTARS